MTATPLFHVGILVTDLDAAIAALGRATGLTFAEPAQLEVQVVEDGGARPCPLRLTFSEQGPPYLELIEAHEQGVFGLDRNPEGLHHVALWQPGLVARIDELAAAGAPREAALATPAGQVLVAYLRPDRLHGTRIELVDPGERSTIETYVATGRWPAPEDPV